MTTRHWLWFALGWLGVFYAALVLSTVEWFVVCVLAIMASIGFVHDTNTEADDEA